MICCIRTKGRPNTKTYQLFEKAGIEVYHFIEPQDFENYNVPNKVDIKENDRGLGFSNNFILSWAKEKNIEFVLMADDDMNGFGNVQDGKCIATGAEIFLEVLEKSKNLPFEVIGINNRQFAWSETKPFTINKKPVGGCVLLNVKNISWTYHNGMKQDRDFCMQAIQKGNGVLKFNHYWYNCPTIGSNKGGCFEQYNDNKDYEACLFLANKWNGFATVRKANGRTDVKFDMEKLATKLKKIVK